VLETCEMLNIHKPSLLGSSSTSERTKKSKDCSEPADVLASHGDIVWKGHDHG